MEEQTAFFLEYLPMEISLIAMEEAVLPEYLGSTLRGVIGYALYDSTEAYSYLYHNHLYSKGHKDITNPYIIIPPSERKNRYQKGKALRFHILLLGNAAQYAKALIDAVKEVPKYGLGASRHPFKLVKVKNSATQRVIWKDGSFYLAAAQSIALPYRSLPDVSQALVTIRSPLRIRRNGALLESIDFPTVIRNVTRRLEALTARYGGWVDTEKAQQLKELSASIGVVGEDLQIQHLERYSNRLEGKMDLSGLMGSILFKGELTPFVPWLYAAQTLHIGRNTTFGMGQIEVEFI